MAGWKHKKTSIIVGNQKNPTKMEAGQVIINKKATKQNLNKLIDINNDGLNSPKEKITTDGTDGGILKGKPHYDKNGNSLGGIPVVVDGGKRIEVEGDEFVVNKEASQKHWKELSKINQSAGNGVAINPQDVGYDEDPQEYKEGGAIIEFNPNDLPNKWIYSYAKNIKEKYPKVWGLGGNIFGNEAFKNLERVLKRGYWTDNEEWMYIKWRSFVARHKKDYRIAGVIAMLKWVDKVEKGWPYMKDLIEKEIAKKYPSGWKHKMTNGGNIKNLTEGDLVKFIHSPKASVDSKVLKVNGNRVKIEILADYTPFKKRMTDKDDWFRTKTYADPSTIKQAVKRGETKLVNSEKLEIFDEKRMSYYPEDQIFQSKEFNDAFKEYLKTKKVKGGPVTYRNKYNKKYGYEKNESHNLDEIAKDTDVSKKGLQKIYNKGVGAYKTNPESVRPNVKSKEQWAMARVYSAVMGGKAAKIDDKELKMNLGGELKKGIKTEQEHKDTLEKIASGEISVNQAIKMTAKDHLKENPKYYTELSKIEKMTNGGSTTTIENGDIVRGDYFPKIYGNFLVLNAGADAVKVRNLLTGEESIKDYRDFTLFLKKGSGQTTATQPVATTKTYGKNFKFNIGDKVIYKTNNEKGTIKDKEFFGGVYFYNILFDTGIIQDDIREIDLELTTVAMPTPALSTNDIDNPPSYLPSTVSSNWTNEFNVGDKVRVRVDFTGDKKKYNTVIKDQENTYDKPENVFTIESFIKDNKPFKLDNKGNNIGGAIRPENPSGKLYTLSNGQAWEGKDLELVRATNNKDAIKAQASKPKFVSMDFQPFLQNWVNSNFINSTDLTKKEIVKDTITDFILDVEAVDGNQTIKFDQEAKILDNIDNYIN